MSDAAGYLRSIVEEIEKRHDGSEISIKFGVDLDAKEIHQDRETLLGLLKDIRWQVLGHKHDDDLRDDDGELLPCAICEIRKILGTVEFIVSG